jgi:hypothetical protein
MAVATSSAMVTHPKNVRTLYSVASWISGVPAGIVASATMTGQYSRKYASRMVDSTQTLDAIPTINRFRMPRPRSTESRSVPWKPL